MPFDPAREAIGENGGGTTTASAQAGIGKQEAAARALAGVEENDPDPFGKLKGCEARPDETQALAGQLEAVEIELAEANAFMEAHGFSVTVGRRVAALEERQRGLVERLAEARQE